MTGQPCDYLNKNNRNARYQAVTGDSITLDFIYGEIEEDGSLIPLDGQQRLTTLFLLHWYAGKKAGISDEELGFLKGFTYETRYSARDFCGYLAGFTPFFEGEARISDEIIDQAWFPYEWQKDATIDAMLVMIDAIDDKFKHVPDLWQRLKNGSVNFYFLPLKDMGLTDEIYIRMNSRGKPLTQFEHFKAELERELRQYDAAAADRVMRKTDRDWTDMLWGYRGEDNVADDKFQRYFRFICDIICYEDGGTPQGKQRDEFDLIKEYFSAGCSRTDANIKKLEAFFDCWSGLGGAAEIRAFQKEYISLKHEPGKIVLDTVDIFNDCLRNYADVVGRGRRLFPLGKIVILYAIAVYLQNRDHISEGDFRRRLRIINNLVRNSEYELSDSELRASGNRLPAILRQSYSIITDGRIILNAAEIGPNFNAYQLLEEQEKLKWTDEQPELSEQLFSLEDHDLLQGQIAVIGIENTGLADNFRRLFECDWDLADCALMAAGEYGQLEANGWRCQMGSGDRAHASAWRDVFHKSRSQGFENTKNALVRLLSATDNINEYFLKGYIKYFIDECEARSRYPFRYYYIKYDTFRMKKYGKFCVYDWGSGHYRVAAMATAQAVSANTRQVFLYAADPGRISRDDCGMCLLIDGNKLYVYNDSYRLLDPVTKEVLEKIDISQEDGIDTEDRILKLKEYLQKKSCLTWS